jgi:hypothetical protein
VTTAPQPLTAGALALLWVLVLIELVSPVPALLTLGAIWVLLFRPPWFLELVRRLYADGGAGRDGEPVS